MSIRLTSCIRALRAHKKLRQCNITGSTCWCSNLFSGNIKWHHFTYLSPFGRLTVGLITTMWIPRNDWFVFLDKISFRVCGSQCSGYVRAVRGTSGCRRHYQQADVEGEKKLDFNSSRNWSHRLWNWNLLHPISRTTRSRAECTQGWADVKLEGALS